MNRISSNDSISIDFHFKVAAGPGAGKTHWLINHIREVLAKSTKLTTSQKIACITYTNTGARTIQNRIPHATDHVEVSTFHSFLYKFIVKPYLHLISEEYNINLTLIKGHDEPFCKKEITKTWINSHQICENLVHPYTPNQLLKLPENLEKVHNWLLSIKYNLTLTQSIEIVANNSSAFSLKSGKRTGLKKTVLINISATFAKLQKTFFLRGDSIPR